MFANAGSFLFAWFNAPFTLLLGISLLLALLQLIGLGGDHSDGDTDLDHDVDLDAGAHLDLDHDLAIDHDLDLDHSVDLDHDVDLQHDVDLEHGADVEHSADLDHSLSGEAGGHDGGLSTLTLLAYLGVGKVPLTVLLVLLTGSIGLLGWVLNSLVQFFARGGYPGLLFAAVLPGSLLGAGLLTARVARIIGSALPPISTTAVRNEALVGSLGTVISPYVDQQYGQVHVRDRGGTLISIFAICGDPAPIRRGEKVVLLSYDPKSRLYTVTRAPASVELLR
jgi:membrane protein implicated in regulation of membrane protease activity